MIPKFMLSAAKHLAPTCAKGARSFAVYAASNDTIPVILRREDAEGSQNAQHEILRCAQDDVGVMPAPPARAPFRAQDDARSARSYAARTLRT